MALPSGDADPRPGHSRRRFLAGAAVAGGVAWVTPAVLSVNTPAAAGTLPPCTPTFVDYTEVTAINNNPPTLDIQTVTVNPVTVGTAMGHVAIAVVDHLATAAASTVTALDAGWTLLGFYDSDVTTAGTTGSGSTAVLSQRVYVWYRLDDGSGLLTSYNFDVEMYQVAAVEPQARILVATYQDAEKIADDAGEFALQGTDPANTTNDVPAITTDKVGTLVVGVMGANYNVGGTAFTQPTGYTLDIVADGGFGPPPIWVFSQLGPAVPGAVPATTATTNPGSLSVGGQLTVECK